MTAFGPLAVMAIVLVVSGAFKIADPRSSEDMLRALWLGSTPAAARTLGAAEICLGAATVLSAGRLLAAALASVYLVFAIASLRLRRTAPERSCGCFGSRSTPPSSLHVAVDLGGCAAGAAAVATGAPGAIGGWWRLPYAGVPEAIAIAVAAWLVVVVMTTLPATLAAARR